jgi:osmotically-inducible protein OsmY
MTSHEPHRAAGDDNQPRSELADRVHAMLGRRVSDFRVEFDGRGLILRGRAESYHAKQLAQHVAMAALGLPLSANEIVVSDFRRETSATEEE